ncbi:MAG TPA: AraC family transcriptional regulator [Phycisphaerae bacterium]|nr:AraC family transcriptional regulator [Phycisphaerae bacterium]HPS52632.1 AraC family transcriptional regulator [Phycisphaerae bacterium]
MLSQIDVIKKSEQRPGFRTLQKTGLGVEYLENYENHHRWLHSHNYIEMSYILAGQCFHELAGQRFSQAAGTLSIINFNQTHNLETQGAIKVVNIYLDIDKYPLPLLPEKLNCIVPMFLSLHPNFAHNLNRIIQIKFSHPETIESLLRLMHEELSNPREGHNWVLSHYFELFLTECCRQILADDTLLSARSDDDAQFSIPLEKARLFIDKNFSCDITLKQIAATAGYQPNYFCRIFKQYAGLPLFEYIIQRRIEQAMILLRSTDEKVLSVAYRCGFNDLSHFNRCFQKTVGLTPGQYRKSSQPGE